MQNRRAPSLFRTRTTLLTHGRAVGSNIPCSFISATCLSITSRYLNGCRRRGFRTGRYVPVSIRYSTNDVRPIQYSPLEKIASFSCSNSRTCSRCGSVSSFGQLSITCRTTSTSGPGLLCLGFSAFGSMISALSSLPKPVPFLTLEFGHPRLLLGCSVLRIWRVGHFNYCIHDSSLVSSGFRLLLRTVEPCGYFG